MNFMRQDQYSCFVPIHLKSTRRLFEEASRAILTMYADAVKCSEPMGPNVFGQHRLAALCLRY